MYEGSFSSISSPTLVFCVLLVDSHSDNHEVISHCGFDLHFLMISYAEHLPFWKNICLFFCPFFNGVVCLVLSCMSCLYMLDTIGHIICRYFLPFSRLSFHFVSGFLCCAKAKYNLRLNPDFEVVGYMHYIY